MDCFGFEVELGFQWGRKLILRDLIACLLLQALAAFRHRLNGYFAQRLPSLFLASSFRNCLSREVLKGMLPWRTRYPLS